MNVLITGGTGALGLHVANRLLDGQCNVVLYDLFPRDLDFIEKGKMKRTKVVQGDILDLEKLIDTIKKYEIRAMIHAAALLSDETCNKIPVKALNVNTWGTLNALEAAKVMNLEKIVFVSSGAIYGNHFPGPLPEETDPDPVGIYTLSKRLSEMIGFQYRRLYGVNFLVVRIGAVYGPGQTFLNHAGRFVKDAVAGIPVHLKTGGDHLREWVYIKDVAEGIVLTFKKKNPQQIYNIGTGVLNTILEVADCVKFYISDANIEVGKGKLDNVHLRGPMSITRAQNDMNYNPKYSLKEGIGEYIKYEKSRLRQKSRANDDSPK